MLGVTENGGSVGSEVYYQGLVETTVKLSMVRLYTHHSDVTNRVLKA